jgi:hypothetical protein
MVERLFKFWCALDRGFCVGEVNDNSERLLRPQLARPSHDEVLNAGIEIPFAKRKWIERMKELSNLLHTQLYRVAWRVGIQHG